MAPETTQHLEDIMSQVNQLLVPLDGEAAASIAAIFLNVILDNCHPRDFDTMDDMIDQLADRLKAACRDNPAKLQ